MRLAAMLVLFPQIAMAALFGQMFAGARPSEVGTGVLAPCPDKSNCVRSGAADARHAIAPIVAKPTLPEAFAKLLDVAAAMPGARVVVARDGYAHLEFISKVMGFVDDVEFASDPLAGVIQVRSASRVGRSDFGVNRRRIEALREAFGAATGTPVSPR